MNCSFENEYVPRCMDFRLVSLINARWPDDRIAGSLDLRVAPSG